MESTNPYNNLPGHGIKFHEGWLEHKNNDGKWLRYWCVLKNNVFYIFSSDHTAATLKQIGTLSLDQKSRLEYRNGDTKSGYKFDLHTHRRLSHFKVQKSCEREIWKAYVEGIIKGRISDTIDLLPGQIREVQDRLGQYFASRAASPMSGSLGSHPVASRRDSTGSIPSLHSGGSTNSFDSPDVSDSGSFLASPLHDYYLTPITPMANMAHEVLPDQTQWVSGTSIASLPGSQHQEPTQLRNKRPISDDVQGPTFYSGSQGREYPSWYFPNCTRPQAEQILKMAPSYGNTLMRSRPEKDFDLAISKLSYVGGEVQFSHFIVKCHPNGYKIDVENPHEPMGSLSEVMQFFAETSGRLTTQPMRCNDLVKLGLAPTYHNPYNTAIVHVPKDTQNVGGRPRYPHTTKEASSHRKHLTVMNVSFSPRDLPDFPPPPPPPLPFAEASRSDQLSLSSNRPEVLPKAPPPSRSIQTTIQASAFPPSQILPPSRTTTQASSPFTPVQERIQTSPPSSSQTNISSHKQKAPPPPPCIKPATEAPPTSTRLQLGSTTPSSSHVTISSQRSQDTAQQNVKSPVTRGRIDRSKSEPAIAQEILDAVQRTREEQLKKFERNQHLAMKGKSQSLDGENPPPLPPNHPTAGKMELHNVTRAVNKRLNAAVMDTSENESFLGNSSGKPALKIEAQSAAPLSPKMATLAATSATKKSSHVPPESDSFLDELAKVTAKVTKQPLVVKKAPDVAPKPSSVSKLGPEAGAGSQEEASPVTDSPVKNLASESFRKKLGEMISGVPKSPPLTLPGVKVTPDTLKGTTIDTSDQYENLDCYQNTKEILANSSQL